MAPRVSDMDNELIEARVKFRGTEYVLRELSMTDYDKTVEQATTPGVDGDPDTFDANQHNKILMAKALVEPKMSVDTLYGKGTRLVRALQREVQKLHFDPEKDELEKKGEDTADDVAGEAPPS